MANINDSIFAGQKKQKQMFVIQCCIIYQRPKVNELKVINIGDCILIIAIHTFFIRNLGGASVLKIS